MESDLQSSFIPAPYRNRGMFQVFFFFFFFKFWRKFEVEYPDQLKVNSDFPKLKVSQEREIVHTIQALVCKVYTYLTSTWGGAVG